MKTGAIILAAGFSRRFGGVKLKAVLPDGSTVLQRSVQNLASVLPEFIVVSRQDLLQSDLLTNIRLEPPDQSLLLCEDAEYGMGHSLSCGARAIPPHWDACLICLGDMPFLKPQTLQALVNAAQPDNIVIPTWQGKRGHPVCFGRSFFSALGNSTGDSGARHLLERYSDCIVELDCQDPGVLQDIDTPDDLPAC